MTNFIFDLYGTLVDIKTDENAPEFWESIASCFEALSYTRDSITPTQVKEKYLSLCSAHSAQVGEDGEFDLLEVFKELYDVFGAKEIDMPVREFAYHFRVASTKKLQLFPLVKSMLLALKAEGCGVYLLSNAQECFTMQELKDLGIIDLFDDIIISSSAGVKKPSPQIFSLALQQFGLSPHNTYFVGNDLHDDVYGASRAGLKTIYIKTPQSSKRQPIAKPTYHIRFSNFARLYDKLIELAQND